MDLANAIEIRNLCKRFGNRLAVNDVSFAVRAGEVFGFMGADGAGRTTTLRMLLGLFRPGPPAAPRYPDTTSSATAWPSGAWPATCRATTPCRKT